MFLNLLKRILFINILFLVSSSSIYSACAGSVTNCSYLWTTGWSSCSNCRHYRKGTAHCTQVSNGKRCSKSVTQCGNCCNHDCRGSGCGSCPYGSSGTYTCGNCSCMITCPRCCSASTCNSGETTTSSSYGASCNATTVSRSNGCGHSVTCYTHKSAIAGTCATGYVTSSASCALGVESSYVTTNAACGGSNRTCYKCKTCTPAAGTCNSGDYTTAAAAIGAGTCKYGYTSYTTINAACGGTNITCYRRLAVYTNPTSGSCALGEQTTACNSSQIQINTYTTTNAACGGANITCYQCSLATCSSVNLNDGGDPDCRYCLDKNDNQCPPPSPTPIPDPENICTIKPNQIDPNKCILITNGDGSLGVSCSDTSASNPYIFYKGNDSGDGSSNYRPIACSELGAEYTTANQCTSSQLPVPIENFCDGNLYFQGIASQCVTCLDVSAPWFQVVNGNIYAKETIESEINLAEVPVMRSSDLTCSADSAFLSGVGIPVAGDKVLNITSQTDSGMIANFSNGFASIDPEDYKFFARYFGYTIEELTDPDNVKRCPADLNSNDSSNYTFKDAFICLIQGENNFQEKLSDFLPDTTGSGNTEIPLTVPAGIKKVIFVNGDILLDRKVILESGNETQEQGFLMLIASGDIEISSYLGDFLTAENFTAIGGSCANQEPALHGIFIANGNINFAGGGTNNSFTNSTVNRSCDKKLTVKGSFIGWGKNESSQPGISMNRTFFGCVPGSFADPTVPTYTDYNLDYNSKTPVLTFVYDNNLLRRLPNWINKTVWMRFEVN